MGVFQGLAPGGVRVNRLWWAYCPGKQSAARQTISAGRVGFSNRVARSGSSFLVLGLGVCLGFNSPASASGGVARTTSYTYDNAGQMTGATLPDVGTLGYSYDAAHRLTGVTDAKGHRHLHARQHRKPYRRAGQGPIGNLQRNITRVYDALNRVQQVTGASN
ncbi:RHS repeat domain-containing protein [Polaromonas sp. CT11-55]|uniref:RHS repeat domain-containing protein n=1 Tax=Polaromonas sp. CT11-55 TaxID=3243045 RepID=UPI0039A66F7F